LNKKVKYKKFNMAFQSPIIHEIDYQGQKLRFETGYLALQADGNVLVTCGDTTVMATVVVGKKDSSGDYFPLQIVYEERLYASGKIKGSRFLKREARPSDNAILTGRLVDRSIRSLFDSNLRREVQIVITILSLDEINTPDTLSVLAASAALQKAGLGHLCPPIACAKLGLVDKKYHQIADILKNYDSQKAQKLAQTLDISKAKDKELFSLVFRDLKLKDGVLAADLKQIYKTTRESLGHQDNSKSENLLVINPSYFELEHADLELVVSGNGKDIMMVEAAGSEITEEQIGEGFDILIEPLQTLTKAIQDFTQKCMEAKVVQKQDLEVKPAPQFLFDFWLKNEELKTAIFFKGGKQEREQVMKAFEKDHFQDIDRLKDFLLKPTDIYEHEVELSETFEKLKQGKIGKLSEPDLWLSYQPEILKENLKNWIESSYYESVTQIIRQAAISDKKRVDGRALDETRAISCEVGVLARTHGSSLFNRGETQVLNVLTLGSTSDAQTLDEMEDFEEQTKRYIHHYNFPSYSVGETGRYGAPGRREIGHGALAEKALLPVLPDVEDFPYTIRLVSECLGSNGSTSMASTCASTLSLMDAGVPIKKPVAGVAMGLMLDSKTGEYEVLTDIQGLEDHHGDMDFKVTGTVEGVTALQLDNKAAGLTPDILKEALHRAKAGRLHILNIMTQLIEQPRKDLSPFAPRVLSLDIPMDKIVEVIGPSGKIIKGIITKTNVDIDIEDKTGKCFIFGKDAQMVDEAYKIISEIIREYQPGEKVQGEVFRIETYGAFVRLSNGKEGLIHISELAPFRIAKTEDAVKLNQQIECEVLGLNEKGQLMLSYKKFSKATKNTESSHFENSYKPRKKF
jgi:polyribonucleotide nucleotidyltransferase